MRKNLIEFGAMLAVSAALIFGAMDRANALIDMNGCGENRVVAGPSSVATDRSELPAAR